MLFCIDQIDEFLKESHRVSPSKQAPSNKEKLMRMESLPKTGAAPNLSLKSNQFLKFWKQKEEIHGNREQARNIAKNLGKPLKNIV